MALLKWECSLFCDVRGLIYNQQFPVRQLNYPRTELFCKGFSSFLTAKTVDVHIYINI